MLVDSTKTKTKLVWSVTHSGLAKKNELSIVNIVAKYGVDAIRSIYYSGVSDSLASLREDLSATIPSNTHQPADGCVPFVLHLVGRRAFLINPNTKDLDVQDGEILEIDAYTDLISCASGSLLSRSSNRIEIVVSSEDQLSNIKENSILSINYGSVTLRVDNLNHQDQDKLSIRCTVIDGGTLRTGIAVHSSDMSRDLFPLLPEDEKSLNSHFNNLADFIIVEGIRTADEFFYIKNMILGEVEHASERHPSVRVSTSETEPDSQLPPRFFLKVDSRRSYDLIPTLLKYIDGIYLSRSELSIDEHPHNLAILQKELISECNEKAKTIIIASELMNSMRTLANPTRAEVSDMANAAADGADAVLLVRDVTEGAYPDLVAEVSKETLRDFELWSEKKWPHLEMTTISTDDDAVTYGAVRMAQQAQVKAIVCFTEGGYTAMKLSSMQTPLDIIAITYNKKIMRQMNLLRSVIPVLLQEKSRMESILNATKDILMESFGFKKGDKFIFVSLTVSSLSVRNSNMFTIQEIDA